MATIYDVAKHASVSIATVSKVLSGRPYVSDKTRARVLASVSALDYAPNMAARSLAGERTNVVGVVISYNPDDLFADPNLLQVLYGVDAVVTEHDHVLLLSTSRSADDPLSAFRRLLGGYRVDGVLVESGLGEDGVALLTERDYPCVVIGYSARGLPCVHPDDYEGARLMTTHLLELGHRRIGVISGPRSSPLAMRVRLAGYRDALEQAGLPFRDELVTFGTFRSASGAEGAAELMALPEPPTAIFAFNDRMAFGATHWLREHDLHVPRDVSVAGFDDIASAAQFDPPLTTVRQSSAEIGRRAATMLFDLMSGNASASAEVVLPTELIVRRSTAPVAAKGGV